MNWAIRGDKEPDKNKQLHILSVKEYEELSEELAKYKRAFEILKDKGIVEIEKYTNIGSVIYKAYGCERYLEQEEYELLEELMKGE